MEFDNNIINKDNYSHSSSNKNKNDVNTIIAFVWKLMIMTSYRLQCIINDNNNKDSSNNNVNTIINNCYHMPYQYFIVIIIIIMQCKEIFHGILYCHLITYNYHAHHK